MKGVVNKGIQELVESKFDSEKWEKIKSLAGCNEPFFSISEDYPDKMTLDLASSASGVLGIPIDILLVEFGKFWIMNTGKTSYPMFFKLAGSSPREFLLNMNRVHKQVTKSIPNATPPVFIFEELPDGRLLMHYKSERGLCSALFGLILGVGMYFNQELKLIETSCMKKGDTKCTMEITFP
jgi:predicted hydrocarbon binding protein